MEMQATGTCVKFNFQLSLHVHNSYNKNIEVFRPPFILAQYYKKLLKVASNMVHNTHNKTNLIYIKRFLSKLVVALEFGFV